MRTRTARALGLAAAAVGLAAATAVLTPTESRAQPKGAPVAAAGVNPLWPKNDTDFNRDYSACATCHGNTLPINVQTNLFARNFKSNDFVLLNEGLTWIAKDPHSKAFAVLDSPLGKQMSTILGYDVKSANQCLTCHATDTTPQLPLAKKVFPTKKPDDLQHPLQEGVTCTACHGIRLDWQAAHYQAVGGTIPWRGKTPGEKEQAGMRDLRNPTVKAQLCASCHVGSDAEGKVVTHEMYAAGHPPLPPFELGTFMEGEPQHWAFPTSPELSFFSDKNTGFPGEAKIKEQPNWRWNLYHFHPEKDEVLMARQITAGAIASLQAEMRQLAADAGRVHAADQKKELSDGVDFARFDCYACHHDLKYPSDRQARGYGGRPPGRPPLKAWVAALPGVVAEHATGLPAFKDVAGGFKGKWAAVEKAATARPFGDPGALQTTAADMADWCAAFLARDAAEGAPVYTPAESARLLAMIGAAAESREWSGDAEAAMHLTWAYLTLANKSGKTFPESAVKQLGTTIPTQVRTPPFDNSKGEPVTVGERVGERMKLFRSYNAASFREAFGALAGKKQ